ncbi:MAG: type I DNA topoisomerase [Bacteroidales bacterium]|nr:type I DNA topoisomerase [Bacteroidales bacterium]
MEGNLVIVESPGKIKNIQNYLGKDFVVMSSFGHIRDLNEKKLSIDIEHDFTPEYEISPDKKKVVSELKKAVSKAQSVWLASDEDREGEAIAWHLATILGLDPAQTKRIVFHEITKNAIQEAVKNPRTINMNLVNAQQARRVLDRLVGFELSPLLWKKVQRGLSAGRVQSVALKLIVDREREIMAFNSEAFYRVEGTFEIEGSSVKGLLDTRFKTLEEARKFLEDSIGNTYTIASVTKKDGTRTSAAPFTTSTLQQEASRKLHFSVSRTMRIAQSLYERGLITYMRTDSTNLSSLAVNTAKKYIVENFGEQYSRPRQYKTKTKGAQEAHEAIRPTYLENNGIEGTAEEKKLYSLIWKRTIASQMTDARTEGTTVKISQQKRSEQYTVQATRIVFDGFLKVYMESTDDEEEQQEQIIPQLAVGQQATAVEINAECKFTAPPLRYSEATLVKKLEELGIGRPSTYSTIINTLTKGKGYVTEADAQGEKRAVRNLRLKGGTISESSGTEAIGAEKRKFIPQEIGIVVSDYLAENFKDIMDYDFTARVEEDFDKIAEGKMEWKSQIASFYAPFHAKVADAGSEKSYSSRIERVLGKDPASGEEIVAKFGQYGPYVRKGDGENRQYANLAAGQFIETITLEEALKLFELPRTVGEYNGAAIIVTKGKFGPYLKYDGRNVALPKGKDPLAISLDECISLIAENDKKAAVSNVISEFPDADISVINGRYGAYIKHAGNNYRLPKGNDPATLTEQDCKAIIEQGAPTSKGRRHFRKK